MRCARPSPAGSWRDHGSGANATVTPARRGTRGAARAGVLPAAVAAAATVAVPLITQVPLVEVLRYAAYLLLGVLLPGVLVHRALRGRQVSLPVDLALGAATG